MQVSFADMRVYVAALYLPGIFLLFQCILMYLALSYRESFHRLLTLTITDG